MGGQGSIRPANLRISNSSTHIASHMHLYNYTTLYKDYYVQRGKLPPGTAQPRAPSTKTPHHENPLPCR